MTVQNYIGQQQQVSAELDLSELDSMIYDIVRGLLMEIFSESETGEITLNDENYYTKSQIETKLRDYLTKALAANLYATNSDLDEYLTKLAAASIYCTRNEADESIQHLYTTVQNNYLRSYDASRTYARISELSNYYNKDEVDTRLANVSSGGTVDLSNYLTKSDAGNTYATKTSLANYLGISDASNIYATIASLESFLTKTAASSAYATIADMADEINAIRNYVNNYYYDKEAVDTRIANVSSGGTVDLSNYLTKSDAGNTYATLTTLNDDYYTKSQVNSAIASAGVDLSAYLKKSDAALTYAKIGAFLTEPFHNYSTFYEDIDRIYPRDGELIDLYSEIVENDLQGIKPEIDDLLLTNHSSDLLYEHFTNMYDYFKELFMKGYISSDQLLFRCFAIDNAVKYLRTKSGKSYDYTETQAIELIRDSRVSRGFVDDERSEPMISNLASWSAGGNLGLDGYWHDVAFGHGVFVAVGYTRGYAGVAAYSTTAGKTWTPSTGAILTTNAYWDSITYGKGRFVALATTARQEGNENFIAYSDDFGKTWILAENVPKEQGLSFITYGGGRFIALGDVWAGTDGRYMAYSDDGIKWTANKLPEFYDVGAGQGVHVNLWKTAAYGDGRWVAITNYNTSAYSEDGGITWTKGGDLPYETTYGCVAFGNHRFVAITAMPRKTKPLEYFSIYSDDGGITWNVGGNVYDSYNSLIYANGRFIAMRAMDVPIENFPHIIYSKDGITWTRKSVGTDNVDNWKGIGYGNGRVVLTVSKAANPSQNTMICACSPLVHSHLS